MQSRIGKYLRFDAIYCSDNFSGFSPSNQLTHVKKANNVLATIQLLGMSTFCEFRDGSYVSLITWAQWPSIKMQFRCRQIQFIFDLRKEIQKDTAKVLTLSRPSGHVETC